MEQPVRCGRCRAHLGRLWRTFLVATPSGNVFVTYDGGLHRCESVTAGDESDALKAAGAMMSKRPPSSPAWEVGNVTITNLPGTPYTRLGEHPWVAPV